MKRLVLDLRSNPGGALDQAIRVVEPLPAARRPDRLHARPRRRTPTRTTAPRDRANTSTCRWSRWSTATAPARRRSSRARCRTTTARSIVGETTFGKALVQSVYRVSQGAGAGADDGALLHAERPADSAAVGRHLRRVPHLHAARAGREQGAHAPSELKSPTRGRKVYSGGGIEPDRRFDGPVEGFNPTRSAATLYARQLFDTYASASRARATRGPARAGANPRERGAGLRGRRRDGGRVQGARASRGA